MTPATIEQARAAKEKVVAMLAALPELRGIGIALLGVGFGVKVNLDAAVADIPEEVDGVPVVVEVVEDVLPI